MSCPQQLNLRPDLGQAKAWPVVQRRSTAKLLRISRENWPSGPGKIRRRPWIDWKFLSKDQEMRLTQERIEFAWLYYAG
jgi:hypothetical protein